MINRRAQAALQLRAQQQAARVQQALAYGAVFSRMSGGTRHCFAVVTRPEHSSGRVVIANWTTLRGAFVDRSCVLRVGDHEWIRHDSYVYYTGAELLEVEALRAELQRDRGLRVSDHVLSAAVLRRIHDGFFTTAECSTDVHSFLLSLTGRT